MTWKINRTSQIIVLLFRIVPLSTNLFRFFAPEPSAWPPLYNIFCSLALSATNVEVGFSFPTGYLSTNPFLNEHYVPDTMDDLWDDFASSLMRAYRAFRSNHRIALQQSQYPLQMEVAHEFYICFEEEVAFALLKTYVVGALAHHKIGSWAHLHAALDTLYSYMLNS